jgi:hypothetical protein
LANLERQADQVSGVFVYAEGDSGPNAAQRKQVIELWARFERPPPIAVVAKSPAVGAMITALNFFLARPILGFKPEAIDDALDYVGVPSAANRLVRQVTWSALTRMKAVQRLQMNRLTLRAEP